MLQKVECVDKISNTSHCAQIQIYWSVRKNKQQNIMSVWKERIELNGEKQGSVSLSVCGKQAQESLAAAMSIVTS